MKLIIGAIFALLAFSHSSFAAQPADLEAFAQENGINSDDLYYPTCSLVADCDSDDDDSDNYARVCVARDSAGKSYKYYLHWHEDAHVQRQAMKKCRAESSRPNTCRAGGCARLN